MKKLLCLLAVGSVGLSAVLPGVTPAHAAERVKVGILVCQVGASLGMIVQSKQQLDCTFTPTAGPDRRYKGTIERVGIDLGATGAGMMSWAVAAVSKDIAPGALTGRYAGVSGDIALGIGVGANALVGTDQSIALNPVSVEGNIGASLALGVASMTLTAVP